MAFFACAFRTMMKFLIATVVVGQGGCPNGGPSSVVFNKSAAAKWEARAPEHFSRSGRPLRLLEPEDGICLHGAGQDPYSFSTYTKFMSSDAGTIVPPTIFMTYMQLKDFNTTKGIPSAFTGLNNSLACYGDESGGVYLIPQIGLAMTTDDGDGKTPPYDADVAAGLYDYAIQQFALGLKVLGGRPVFLRIGYEFNGKWNNYGNDTFIESWIRIHKAVRADSSLSNVAFVWDYSCDEADNPWTRFELPDDSYVDWYGVNVFSNSSGPLNDTACLRPFFEYARSKGFPVIFAESTPRYVGAQAANGAWDRWFSPLMSLISEFDDVVKAWCYINWNWAQFPQWGNWQDARIEGELKAVRELMYSIGGLGSYCRGTGYIFPS